MKEFGEAATMLSATCDEFLKNICDCMDLAESNFGELLFHIIFITRLQAWFSLTLEAQTQEQVQQLLFHPENSLDSSINISASARTKIKS